MSQFFEKRVSQRVPLEGELKIKQENKHDIIIANIKDISTGGILFSIPYDSFKANPGEIYQFVFIVPNLGETVVQGVIRNVRLESAEKNCQIANYGVKLLDLSLATWDSINRYCDTFRALSITQPVSNIHNRKNILMIELPKDDWLTGDIMVRIRFTDDRTIHGQVMFFGFGGLKIQIPESITTENSFMLEIFTETISFVADVVCTWCNKNDESSQYFAGFSFYQLSDSQFSQLKDLVCGFFSRFK